MLSDGTSEQAFSQTLTLTSTSKRNRLEQFVAEFADSCSRNDGRTGARSVSLPRNLQSQYDEPEYFRIVVRICHIDYSRAPARTDLRPHYDG